MFTDLLLTADFLGNILRNATFFIDKGIYNLIGVAYRVFYHLANASLVENIDGIMTRMYTILGVIMVFVLAFNLLNYIVDPDKINDKKMGASTFVKDVILAIVIISLTPMLFTKLYALQSQIIVSGVIDNLILGGSGTDNPTSQAEYEANKADYSSLSDYYIQHGANSMIASTYTAFLYPSDGFTALDCVEGGENGTGGKYNKYCEDVKLARQYGNLNAFSDYITNSDYEFAPFLSTIAGVIMLFFILSFCINLAKRVGKMAIIQLIAPIPVTLELLPNKKGLRQNWLKTLVSVYLEVFFFLLVIYIVIFLISMVPGVVSNLFSTASGENGLVRLLTIVFLIFGLLFFGKEAPQMIFDLLGIKSTGVIAAAAKRAVKMAGSVTSGIGTGATSVVRNGYGAFDNLRKGNLKEAAGNIGGVFTSGVTGVARGMYANRSGGFKGIVGRTAAATNSNLAHQGALIKTVKEHAAGVATGAAIGAGIGAGFGGIGAIPGALIGAAAGANAKDAAIGAGKWATGSGSYTKLNEQISAMTKAKGYFHNVTKGFAPYEDSTRILNEAKAKTNYATDYNAWKLANPTLKEKDFIASIATDPAYAEVVNAFNQQKNVKETRIEKKQEEIINNVLGMIQYIDLNPQIGLSADATTLRDQLKTMVDKDGNIISGDIKTIYSTLDDLSTQLDKDITKASRVIERQKIIEEAKKNGNSGAGGGSK